MSTGASPTAAAIGEKAAAPAIFHRPRHRPMRDSGTGMIRHLVFSTVHTIDASKALVPVTGTFRGSDQRAIRTPLASSINSTGLQRLVPTRTGRRTSVLGIRTFTMRTREYLDRGRAERESLFDAMRDGELGGMQRFGGELEKLLRNNRITRKTALLHASDQGNLQVQSAGLPDEPAAHGLPIAP